MLWNIYPETLDRQTLKQAQASLQGDPPQAIPWLVWLLENPASQVALPGAIDLYGHDCMHLLLKQGFSAAHEAYVVGFTMGNSTKSRSWHLTLIRYAAHYLYPQKYRMDSDHLEIFDVGVKAGLACPTRDLCEVNFRDWDDLTLEAARSQIGIKKQTVVCDWG
jgi:hypothetical protein